MATDAQVKALGGSIEQLCRDTKALNARRLQIGNHATILNLTLTTAGITSSNPGALTSAGTIDGTQITPEDAANILGAFSGGSDTFATFYATNDDNIEKGCPPVA